MTRRALLIAGRAGAFMRPSIHRSSAAPDVVVGTEPGHDVAERAEYELRTRSSCHRIQSFLDDYQTAAGDMEIRPRGLISPSFAHHRPHW